MTGKTLIAIAAGGALAAGAALAILFTLGQGNSAVADVPVGNEHVIEIKSMLFSEPELDVRIGDQVTWINRDVVPHTATAHDKSWDSGQLKQGESFTLTITEETYPDYLCLYHTQMKAHLSVKAP